jgi:hypothetical protein
MKLNVRAIAIASGVLWAVGMFVSAVANIAWPGYGQEFLQAMASLYPGYHATPSVGQAIVGALYALVDAAIAGAIFAWLYNWCVGRFGEAG